MTKTILSNKDLIIGVILGAIIGVLLTLLFIEMFVKNESLIIQSVQWKKRWYPDTFFVHHYIKNTDTFNIDTTTHFLDMPKTIFAVECSIPIKVNKKVYQYPESLYVLHRGVIDYVEISTKKDWEIQINQKRKVNWKFSVLAFMSGLIIGIVVQ